MFHGLAFVIIGGLCASLVAGGFLVVAGVLVVAGGGFVVAGCALVVSWCPRWLSSVAGGGSLATSPAYSQPDTQAGARNAPQRGGHSPSKSKFQRNKNERLLLYISII